MAFPAEFPSATYHNLAIAIDTGRLPTYRASYTRRYHPYPRYGNNLARSFFDELVLSMDYVAKLEEASQGGVVMETNAERDSCAFDLTTNLHYALYGHDGKFCYLDFSFLVIELALVVCRRNKTAPNLKLTTGHDAQDQSDTSIPGLA